MRHPARRRTDTPDDPQRPSTAAPAPTQPGQPALLIVDMISRFDFPGGARLAAAALPVAERIAQVRGRFHRRGWPVLFANDNFADWRTDFEGLWTLCADPKQRGARIAACLAPRPQDYYVLKPKHSAFLGSALSLLLARLQTTHLLVTGIATDACVLATAIDARMRDFQVQVPPSCCAALDGGRQQRALRLLREAFAVHVSERLPARAAG
ncbi:cysteine hydrolase family protein [Xanthomonas sacchari]|uniref:cysteine hydrolase family protein n=1 Tax=Xanthomonas sacchari TaxID=56458 RepID=UPI000A654C17|nr:isochorismatase family cysteine hydrolase [Xanthomonas sacchari]MDV0436808.1 cysteine hydrolase [Xanthomonas sacchari]